MPTTIKEMAMRLGVSPATISLALNGSPVVSQKTRAKVLELANQSDYMPNNFGRGLQSNRSKLIGYVLEGVNLSFFNNIMQAVGLEAAQHNYGLLTTIASTGDKDFMLQNQMKILLEKKIDGLILSTISRISSVPLIAMKNFLRSLRIILQAGTWLQNFCSSVSADICSVAILIRCDMRATGKPCRNARTPISYHSALRKRPLQ